MPETVKPAYADLELGIVSSESASHNLRTLSHACGVVGVRPVYEQGQVPDTVVVPADGARSTDIHLESDYVTQQVHS